MRDKLLGSYKGMTNRCIIWWCWHMNDVVNEFMTDVVFQMEKNDITLWKIATTPAVLIKSPKVTNKWCKVLRWNNDSSQIINFQRGCDSNTSLIRKPCNKIFILNTCLACQFRASSNPTYNSLLKFLDLIPSMSLDSGRFNNCCNRGQNNCTKGAWRWQSIFMTHGGVHESVWGPLLGSLSRALVRV